MRTHSSRVLVRAVRMMNLLEQEACLSDLLHEASLLVEHSICFFALLLLCFSQILPENPEQILAAKLFELEMGLRNFRSNSPETCVATARILLLQGSKACLGFTPVFFRS